MNAPSLPLFPSDQERIAHASAQQNANPPLLKRRFRKWGTLMPLDSGTRATTLSLDVGCDTYNLSIDERNNKNRVDTFTPDGREHRMVHAIRLVKKFNEPFPGKKYIIELHRPGWDKVPGDERDWVKIGDGEVVLGGFNYKFHANRNYLDYLEKPEGVLEHYTVDKKIVGSGASGTVVKVTKHQAGKVFALKIIKAKERASTSFEVSAMKALNHPNICRIEDYFVCSDNTLQIVMEYAPYGTLAQFIEDWLSCGMITGDDDSELTDSEGVAAIMNQLCRAVWYIHSRGIMHRDIKPENIVVVEQGPGILIKLIDFGSANQTKSIINAIGDEPIVCGTQGYQAPEVVDSWEKYGSPADVYSVGVVFYEMLDAMCWNACSQDVPEEKQRRDTLIKRLGKGSLWGPDFSLIIDDHVDAKKLAEGLLQTKARTRLSLQTALANRWLIKMGKTNERLLAGHLPDPEPSVVICLETEDCHNPRDLHGPVSQPPISPAINGRKRQADAVTSSSSQQRSPSLRKLPRLASKGSPA